MLWLSHVGYLLACKSPGRENLGGKSRSLLDTTIIKTKGRGGHTVFQRVLWESDWDGTAKIRLYFTSSFSGRSLEFIEPNM